MPPHAMGYQCRQPHQQKLPPSNQSDGSPRLNTTQERPPLKKRAGRQPEHPRGETGAPHHMQAQKAPCGCPLPTKAYPIHVKRPTSPQYEQQRENVSIMPPPPKKKPRPTGLMMNEAQVANHPRKGPVAQGACSQMRAARCAAMLRAPACTMPAGARAC
jgi:hypothetical protein